MIDRQGGRLIIECETCSEVFEGERGAEFNAVWSAAKADGWKAERVGHDWIHRCPHCGGDK